MSDITRTLQDQPAPAASAATLTWLFLLLCQRDTPVPPRRTGGARLTPRETEVLRFVTLGWTNAEVAAHLCLSRRTVDQHLTSIYNRLGVSCRAAATRRAMLDHLC